MWDRVIDYFQTILLDKNSLGHQVQIVKTSDACDLTFLSMIVLVVMRYLSL